MYETTRASQEEQEKLNVLVRNFRKLDENRKDRIQELTRKLAKIHYSGGFADAHRGKGRRKRIYL